MGFPHLNFILMVHTGTDWKFKCFFPSFFFAVCHFGIHKFRIKSNNLGLTQLSHSLGASGYSLVLLTQARFDVFIDVYRWV